MPGKTLLIVEDSADVRRRIRAVVDAIAGIGVVVEAADANGAIELLERHRPDLMTLDLRLAGGSSGLEVLRHLPEYDSEHDRLPAVIVLSSDVAQLGSHRLALPGVRQVLDKIMDFHRLGNVLTETLSSSDTD